jgi:hypothetical protein
MTDIEPSTELAIIEWAMGDRHSEYFTGPRIEGETLMARRYRSLVAGASPDEVMSPARPAPAVSDSSWASATGQQVLGEWAQQGGVEHNYEAARALIAKAYAAVPEETRADLQSQIDRLPAAVQVAMVAGLANPYVPASAATPVQIARFSSTSDGAELVRAWGPSTPRRLAMVAARVRCLVGRLLPDDAASFAYFADNISGAEFKALANYLSA